MKSFPVLTLGLSAMLAAGAARAAPPFQDCPFAGPMPNYTPTEKPTWENWDTRTFIITKDGNNTEFAPEGVVCIQNYSETPGKTDGSTLENSENYKEAWEQLGAEIVVDRKGYIFAHLRKDGKEYWLNESGSRDDGYAIREVAVAPLQRTLTAPSGNDYRLLGHMPGFVADAPTKKNFDEFTIATDKDPITVRGAFYRVNYQPPAKPPERPVTPHEIMANYRAALTDLHAQFLRNDTVITARLEDQGKVIWISVGPGSVTAVEEKPFKLTVQPPTADAMRDKLDKEGHIALYINFDFDKATLKPDAQPIVAQIVALLKNNPDLKVSIDGNTDSIGGHDYNMKLSQDRAAAVVAAITTAGIDAARLHSAGYGPDKPIAANDTEEGRAKNRRVELVKS
jgi:outer membrane protein OmpA-like peptidoglycan-associated protein